LSEAKKYPCQYGLVEDCEARRFLEVTREAEVGAEMVEVAKKEADRVVKHLKFDDAESLKRMMERALPTIEEMGRAFARGFGMKVNAMADFCRMCPRRSRATTGEHRPVPPTAVGYG